MLDNGTKGRRSRYVGKLHVPPVERDGDAPYSYVQLLRMNQRFVERVERAIARGLERPCDEPHKSHTLGIIRIAGRENPEAHPRRDIARAYVSRSARRFCISARCFLSSGSFITTSKNSLSRNDNAHASRYSFSGPPVAIRFKCGRWLALPRSGIHAEQLSAGRDYRRAAVVLWKKVPHRNHLALKNRRAA
jgi:hypothetical protein